MKIVSTPTATPFEIGRWLASKDATTTFVRWICTRLWDEAIAEGVDPVGVIAQAGKETAFGRYGGAVKPWMHNTCGLKVERPEEAPGGSDSQFAHATFANWIVGARAHVQHLLAYVGRTPRTTIVDPRFHVVPAPSVTEWSDLGGRWAPSSTYGLEIEAMMQDARG